MKAVARKSFVVGFLGLLALSWAQELARGQPVDPRLAKVFEDWKQRQTRFQSVRYQVTGERVNTPNQLIGLDSKHKPIKQETKTTKNVSCPRQFSMLLDFTKGRHRLEVRQQIFDYQRMLLYPRVTYEVFDGKLRKTAIPRAENVSEFHSLSPQDADMDEQEGGFTNFTPEYWPILVGHGVIPTVHRPIVPGMLKVKPEKVLFYIHGQGVHAQRNCLVIRTHPARQNTAPNFNEFWIDEAKDSAVVRTISYYDAQPLTDIEISYDKLVHGWMPKEWTWVDRDNEGKTNSFWRMRVEEFVANPPFSDEDFRFDVKPGMTVHKTKIEEPAVNKSEAERIHESAYKVSDDGHLVPIGGGSEVQSWSRYLWFLAPILGLIGMFLWLSFRAKSRPNKGG